MALPIKQTPKLNRQQSKDFLRRVKAKAGVPSYPVPTPISKEYVEALDFMNGEIDRACSLPKDVL